MKVLIIGSEGFIGKHCSEYFTKKGYAIFRADIVESTQANYVKLNLIETDFNILFENNIYDVCINCSGSANVGFSFNNPSIDFELNVLNVQKILVLLKNYNLNCRFINFSSAAVYGNPKVLPIKEDAILEPLSPYGFHKQQSELLLSEYHHFFGLKTCSLRVFSAYGPGLKKQLFWDLYQKGISNNTIQLFGTGYESRDFIYIDDLVKVVDLVIQNSSLNGNVYNLASGVEATIKDVVDKFIYSFDKKLSYQFTGETKIGDPINWKADISKIQDFGFKPEIIIDEGINRYLAWLTDKK